MSKATNLWGIKWEERWSKYPSDLWVLANNAEQAAKKARRFLQKTGNTLIKIKAVTQNSSIDVF